MLELSNDLGCHVLGNIPIKFINRIDKVIYKEYLHTIASHVKF